VVGELFWISIRTEDPQSLPEVGKFKSTFTGIKAKYWKKS